MNWIFFALAGSVAQLIDGTLGMGFGLTSSTLLLTLGASAAVASAAVHAAEIGTTVVSGVSHWREENVDMKILKQLAIPGGIGAILGATFLSSIDLSNAKIFISTLLLLSPSLCADVDAGVDLALVTKLHTELRALTKPHQTS